MQLKLPQAACSFPCFKTDTQVYLVVNKTLYSFTQMRIKPVHSCNVFIGDCCSSYYSRGTLYYEMSEGIVSLALRI
jgi:hypothetical protein